MDTRLILYILWLAHLPTYTKFSYSSYDFQVNRYEDVLGLRHLQATFYILFLGHTAAALMFIIEKVVYRNWFCRQQSYMHWNMSYVKLAENNTDNTNVTHYSECLLFFVINMTEFSYKTADFREVLLKWSHYSSRYFSWYANRPYCSPRHWQANQPVVSLHPSPCTCQSITSTSSPPPSKKKKKRCRLKIPWYDHNRRKSEHFWYA